MKRIVLMLAVVVALTTNGAAAAPHHKRSHAAACRLLGVAITFGGDTGEPDLWTLYERCSDGSVRTRTIWEPR